MVVGYNSRFIETDTKEHLCEEILLEDFNKHSDLAGFHIFQSEIEKKIAFLEEQLDIIKSLETQNLERIRIAEEEKLTTILTHLIKLPEDEYDAKEADNMINRISKIDYVLLEALYHKGVTIHLTNTNVTGLKEFAHLRGKVPRGWEELGKTWDDVVGVGGRNVAAKIGYSNPGTHHDCINLELHEIGHSVDYKVLNYISHQELFENIFQEEAALMFTNPYFFKYPDEYFAESFAYYYFSEETRQQLKEKAPKTYEFMKALPLLMGGNS